jgi:hypothetical protein
MKIMIEHRTSNGTVKIEVRGESVGIDYGLRRASHSRTGMVGHRGDTTADAFQNLISTLQSEIKELEKLSDDCSAAAKRLLPPKDPT